MSKINPYKISLTVQYASSSLLLPTRPQLRRWINAALQHEAHITLRIVDEPEGRELNRNYRNKDYATNVLTFVYDNPDPARHAHLPAEGLSHHSSGGIPGVPLARAGLISQPLYGDIVICAPVVEQEAIAQHKNVLAHYAHLTVHGVLHLQGYQHEDENEAAEMETAETALMLKLRYPDPYQATRH